MKTQVAKWGNELAVRIPEILAKKLQLHEGMEIELALEKSGLLLRARLRGYTLGQLLERVTPENLHDETDWGSTSGRECW
jgi:antitoxin MazE